MEKPALRLKNSLDWWRRTTGPAGDPARTAGAAPNHEPVSGQTDGYRGASDTTDSGRDTPGEGDAAEGGAGSDTELRTI